VDHREPVMAQTSPGSAESQPAEASDPVDHTVINSQGTLDPRTNLDIPAFLRRRAR
jgi:hypothetical protein